MTTTAVTVAFCAAACAIGYLLGRWRRWRHYLSTGCLHGDMVLPDGRTGHQYCQGETGAVGAKKPASCKFCAAPCRCACHRPAEVALPTVTT